MLFVRTSWKRSAVCGFAAVPADHSVAVVAVSTIQCTDTVCFYGSVLKIRFAFLCLLKDDINLWRVRVKCSFLHNVYLLKRFNMWQYYFLRALYTYVFPAAHLFWVTSSFPCARGLSNAWEALRQPNRFTPSGRTYGSVWHSMLYTNANSACHPSGVG